MYLLLCSRHDSAVIGFLRACVLVWLQVYLFTGQRLPSQLQLGSLKDQSSRSLASVRLPNVQVRVPGFYQMPEASTSWQTSTFARCKRKHSRKPKRLFERTRQVWSVGV